MKRKYLMVFIPGILLFNSLGCAVLNKPVEFVDEFISSTFFPPYSGPKAKAVITDFEIMAVKATADIGLGLRDLLISGLLKSQRFAPIIPGKGIDEKPAGLIIATELSDFEPYGCGGKSGVGGGGSSASGALGSLLGASVNRSYIALNLRLVDAKSSKVLFSSRFSGQASGDNSPRKESRKPVNLGQGLAVYAGTSMEEAINKCILEAVNYIIEKVPGQYYKEKG